MGLALKHLGESRRAEIARTLFTVTSTDEAKGELIGLCPVHGEKNPSFAYNFKKDLYHCLACGADGDLLRLWTEVKGYNQKEGFKAFCAEFGIPLGDGNDRGGARRKGAGAGEEENPEMQIKAFESMEKAWELFPPLPDPWIERLEKTRGWTGGAIEILDLRMQTHRFTKKGELVPVEQADRIAIPIRDIFGRLQNIRLYKPGATQYKIISWARSTGKNALFPATPPFDGPDDYILLCEGESDTICALSYGFNAITQTSKVKKWPDEQLLLFKNKDVVVAYDADEAGVKYAAWACQALTTVAKSVRSIQWLPEMGVGPAGEVPKDHGQDLTDFFVKHKKTPEDLKALIDGTAVLPASSAPPAPLNVSIPPDILKFFEYGVNKRYSFKPRLLAEHVIVDYKLLSDPDTGLLYRWNNAFWEVFDEDHIKAVAIRCMGNEAQKSRIEDAIYQVRMLSTIPPDRKVNDRHEWIGLRNGMLNFMTFEMVPHAPEFYCTHALPVSFDPESPKRCDRWEQYLDTNIHTPEAIAQAQEFAGYCLVRHTRFEKCLFLLGPGRDGKSTFMKVLKEIVGDENCAAVSFPDLENEFHRSSLYNKLLNISTEIGGQAIESPYFKAITSGDPINAAYKHRDAFTFSPFCKLIFAGNMLPRVKDNSDAYFQRVLPIQFKRQFLEGDPERDPELLEKFKAEISEIFYWALCGLKRLTEQKRFTDCEETRTLLMGYRRSNNPILCYVEDQCILGEGDRPIRRSCMAIIGPTADRMATCR
jgi:putative DNA primase/helicase